MDRIIANEGLINKIREKRTLRKNLMERRAQILGVDVEAHDIP